MGPALGVNQQTVDRLLDIERRYEPGRRQLIQDMKMDYQRLQQAHVPTRAAAARGGGHP